VNRYISFSPHRAGFVNVLMNLEVALSLSQITGRTLIFPPNFWCFSVSKEYGKSHFIDIMKYFDREYIYSNFNCIDFYDVPEFSNLFSAIEKSETEKSLYSYTGNIHNCNLDLKNIIFQNELDEPCLLSDSQCVLYCGDIKDERDFNKFVGRRTKKINLDLMEKFLHFEANLYGTYWYSVYCGGAEERNRLKNKVNRALTYNQKFVDISRKVYDSIGLYNSIHVRRNDFIEDRNNYISDVSTSSKFSSIVRYFFRDDKPIYISTDEKNLSFFDELKKYKTVYFFKDFYSSFDDLTDSIIEQLVCFNSELFYGTHKSTFSKRINIMRGLDGKQACDSIGINQLYSSRSHFDDPLPWTKNNLYWYWDSSSHPQWTYESTTT